MSQAASILPVSVPSPVRRQPPILAAYEHFRLDRQGILVSPRTMEYCDGMVLPFVQWAEADGVQRFEALDGRSIGGAPTTIDMCSALQDGTGA